MKKIQLFASTVIVIIALNIITVHINIQASDMSLDITNGIAIAEAKEYLPPLRPCYEYPTYGGIVGVWKCAPCIFMSFARPWGRFSYCMQGIPR